MTDRIRIKSCLPKGDEHDFKNAGAAVLRSDFHIGQNERGSWLQRDGCEHAKACRSTARLLGAESARDMNGKGITVSYWESLEAIEKWKFHSEHRQAKEKGRTEWYSDFAVRVAKVEDARISERPGRLPSDGTSGEKMQ